MANHDGDNEYVQVRLDDLSVLYDLLKPFGSLVPTAVWQQVKEEGLG